MAKRKRTIKRTIRRVAPKRVTRRSSGMSASQLQKLAIGSAVYGGARGYASDFVQRFGSNLPVVGQVIATVGDEAVLGFAGYMLAKKAKKPMLRNIGTAALVVESARFGSEIGERVNLGKPSAPMSSNIF